MVTPGQLAKLAKDTKEVEAAQEWAERNVLNELNKIADMLTTASENICKYFDFKTNPSKSPEVYQRNAIFAFKLLTESEKRVRRILLRSPKLVEYASRLLRDFAAVRDYKPRQPGEKRVKNPKWLGVLLPPLKHGDYLLQEEGRVIGTVKNIKLRLTTAANQIAFLSELAAGAKVKVLASETDAQGSPTNLLFSGEAEVELREIALLCLDVRNAVLHNSVCGR